MWIWTHQMMDGCVLLHKTALYLQSFESQWVCYYCVTWILELIGWVGLFDYVVEIPLKHSELHKYLDRYKVCYNVHFVIDFPLHRTKMTNIILNLAMIRYGHLLCRSESTAQVCNTQAHHWPFLHWAYRTSNDKLIIDIGWLSTIPFSRDNFFCHFYYDDDVVGIKVHFVLECPLYNYIGDRLRILY